MAAGELAQVRARRHELEDAEREARERDAEVRHVEELAAAFYDVASRFPGLAARVTRAVSPVPLDT
jgi:hypothetical protein